jgi:hypothetical protein
MEKKSTSNVAFLKRQYGEKLPADYSKEKNLPSIIIKNCSPLFDFMGILGTLKFLVFQTIGIFKPIYRQARRSDMRISSKCCISRTELHDQYGSHKL